jgi:hypothetical protein
MTLLIEDQGGVHRCRKNEEGYKVGDEKKRLRFGKGYGLAYYKQKKGHTYYPVPGKFKGELS